MYTYGITGTSLNEFRDTTIVGVTNGQVLKYNSTTSQWENVDPSTLSISLDNLSDVTLTSPSEFQVLEFNGTSWVNQHASVTTYVRNADSVTLGTGTAVYLFGATGDHATVKRADNDSDATSSKTVGLVASPIAPNENGVVVTRGYVDGINLSVGYTAGDILWLGEDGGFTKVKPTAPEHGVFLGVVVRATNNGIVYVAVQNGYELDELHNVAITAGTLDDKDVLAYNNSTGLWENTEVADLGITVDNLSDATITSAVLGNTLSYNGSGWVNRTSFVSNSFQKPVDERRFAQLGTVPIAVPGANIGSATFITFRDACEITALEIYLSVTYTSATTYDYRLGIYNDDNGKPGSLLVDGGTVSIAQNAAAGFKTVTLGTAQAVTAGQTVWLVCAATHAGSVPSITHMGGHIQPYSDYGLTAATHTSAACFAYTTGPATALPATFTLAATETQPAGIAVYAKVNIP